MKEIVCKGMHFKSKYQNTMSQKRLVSMTL